MKKEKNVGIYHLASFLFGITLASLFLVETTKNRIWICIAMILICYFINGVPKND